MPHLHTLDLSASALRYHRGVGAIVDSALHSLPSLTSLSVQGPSPESNPSILSAIAACHHLMRLRFINPCLRAGEFRRLFTSPHMSRLQRLELSLLDATLPAEEYSDAFAAMTGLRHLDLHMVYHIDSLVCGLSRAPHLATVEIIYFSMRPPPPSVAALQTLIAQTETTSRVQVILQLPSGVGSIPFESLVSARFTLLLTSELKVYAHRRLDVRERNT